MIGKTLNHYKILEKLGAGGMGEVYVAEDGKLHRKVALKILPAKMAADPSRRARFEREATAVAALNHPNIVTIHSVEEADGLHFLTMERVDGKTLTQSIPKGGFPLSEFFDLAIPLADAVSAAHKQGITHRDLKPDNVMLGEDGRVKILDFGLAKLREGGPDSAPESQLVTGGLTGEGKVMGTLSYMSPEQAEGKPVDHRTDIFSLGIVLYEMATGLRPFQGDTGISVITSIMRDHPEPITKLNPGFPRHLGRIVRRCLAKNPEERYQTTQDVRTELMELKKEIDSGEVLPVSAAGGGFAEAGAHPRKGRRMPILAAAVMAVSALVIVIAVLMRPVPKSTLLPASSVAGSFTQLTDLPGPEREPSISPDGKMIAYVAGGLDNRDIFVQRSGGTNVVNLTQDSSDSDYQPAFSPDGERIAFRSERDGGGIFVMGVLGESVVRLTDSGFQPAWSPDGAKIVFETEGWISPQARSGTSELWTVDVKTREKERIFAGDAVQPNWSPGGHRIAFWAVPSGGGQRDIWTVSANGEDPVPVTQDPDLDYSPVWSHDGKFLYFSSDRGGTVNLWRIPIDELSGKPLGKPVPVTRGVTASSGFPSLSSDGKRIAYVAAVVDRDIERIPFDLERGVAVGEPVGVVRGTSSVYWGDPSPDGKQVAFVSYGRQEDIYVSRVDGMSRRQLTNDPHRDRRPIWSPDGKRIAFYSDRSGSYEIWTIRPDGTGLTQMTDTPGHSTIYATWSPDGNRLVYTYIPENRNFIIDANQSLENQVPEEISALEGENVHFNPFSWSPDGKKLAGYAATYGEASADPWIVIYDLESKIFETPIDYGTAPDWLSDSRRLLFMSGGGIYLLDTVTRETKEVHSFPRGDIFGNGVRLSADGQNIYLTRIHRQADIWLLDLD